MIRWRCETTMYEMDGTSLGVVPYDDANVTFDNRTEAVAYVVKMNDNDNQVRMYGSWGTMRYVFVTSIRPIWPDEYNVD